MSPSSTPEASDSTVDKNGLAQKGSFNHVIGVLGRPGSGKSYYAATRAREFNEQGCYVLCHDIGWRLPETDAKGKPFGLVRHETAQGAVQRLASDPRGIHCISTPEAGDVISLARMLAKESLKQNGGTQGHPVVLVIDEVVAAGVCDPNYLSEDMRQLISGRRHENIGIIWTCQSARMVNNQLVGLSTEMVLFHMTNERDFKNLEMSGIPEETLTQVASLPVYHHVEHRFQ